MPNKTNNVLRAQEDFNGALIKAFTLEEDLVPDGFVEMDINGITYKIKSPPGQDILIPVGTDILAARDEKNEWFFFYPEPTVFEGYTTGIIPPSGFSEVDQYVMVVDSFVLKIKKVEDGWNYYDGNLGLSFQSGFNQIQVNPNITAAAFKPILQSMFASGSVGATIDDVTGDSLFADAGFLVECSGRVDVDMTFNTNQIRALNTNVSNQPQNSKFYGTMEYVLTKVSHKVTVYNPDPMLVIEPNKYCVFHKIAGMWVPIFIESSNDECE